MFLFKYFLLFVTSSMGTFVAEIDKKSFFPITDNTIFYADIIISPLKDSVKVYCKDLDFLTEMQVNNGRFFRPQVEFGKLFFINPEFYVKGYELKNLTEVYSNLDFRVSDYVIKSPYVLFNDKKGKVSCQQVETTEILWSKKLRCKSIFLTSSSEYAGCLSNRSLTLYDAVTGELVVKQRLSKGNWVYENSWNRGIILSKNKTYFLLTFDSLQLKKINLPFTTVLGFVRQKEIVGLGDDNVLLGAFDIEKNETSWMHFFDRPVDKVLLKNDYVLVKQDNKKINIIEHYLGKEKGSITVESDDFWPKNFYEYNGIWYFFDGLFSHKFKLDKNEETID